jgi:hypothetical protein
MELPSMILRPKANGRDPMAAVKLSMRYLSVDFASGKTWG